MNSRNGIILKILSALCATLMLACVKGLDGAVPTGQVVFFRSFVALLPLLIWLAMQGHVLALVRTRNFGGHLVRGVSGTGGMFFNYLALAYIPLADATALSYAAPLFTVFLAAVFLREKVRIYRWTAVVVGFLGVLIMLSPHLQIGGEGMRNAAIIGSTAALIAALCSAVSSVQIRHLNESEQPGAIVLYFSLMTTGIGLATIFMGWVMPTPFQLLLLVGCGFFGGMAQILITLSLRHAHASLLAPFEYSTMVWSILIGIILLDQSPAPSTIIGAVVVAAAGLFTIWRERVLRRAAARI
ncbi:DMT family transporter [Paenirhodobacter populi]|uniref:DMT family transporter n=1 Tax=Paenirhodobacter populi TaxID=2306993 RepID=A0A443IVF9_9RHOB|nr:DMT family transporter [Sinirhodobacter populi]RWR10221.1 DMT family transporter [Sinirhodobacter populi]RWR12108.1 DMT family transporter [Sinirhodobacter populi]